MTEFMHFVIACIFLFITFEFFTKHYLLNQDQIELGKNLSGIRTRWLEAFINIFINVGSFVICMIVLKSLIFR